VSSAPIDGAVSDDRRDRSTDAGPAGRPWYIVAALFALYLVAIADRGVTALLLDDIRADLGLNDIELGLLQGIGFVAFYSVLGLPAGYLVDRFPRRPILFAGAVIWSVATSCSGLAGNFLQLLTARMAVGASEAAIAPASYSILGDVFPRDRLAAPISVWSAAGALGGALALISGGWLMSIYSAPGFALPFGLAPWRLVLITIGLPGLLLALLAFSFAEPRRTTNGQDASWREFGRDLLANWRPYAGLMLGFGFATLISYSIFAWTPTYLRRDFGFSPKEAGLVLGAMVGLVGGFAHFGNGFVVEWIARRGHSDAPLRFYVLSLIASLPVVIYGFISHNLIVFLAALAWSMLLLTPVTGYAAAAVQAIAPARIRAKIGALFLVVINLFGMGIGPALIAAVAHGFFGGSLGSGSAAVIGGAGICALLCMLWLAPHYRLAFARAVSAGT
jgi:MFS family permease